MGPDFRFNWGLLKYKQTFDLAIAASLSDSLVPHEDVAEGAVEDSVEEVSDAHIEDENICNCSHLVIALGK